MEDNPKHRYRKLKIIGAIAVLLVLADLFFAGPVGPGGLIRRYLEVDIQTGRIRRTYYICGLCVSSKIEDSILTKALPPARLSVPSQWKTVCIFYNFSRISAHYAYHGAIAQINQIEMLQSAVRFSDEAKRSVAETALKLWQNSVGDFVAEEYIRDLNRKSFEMAERGSKELTVNDLPSPPATSSPAHSKPGR
jgi:hypothetical protein